MCVLAILECVKDLVTIIGVSIAGYVGLVGLSAWKKQLKGNQDYMLAKIFRY